MAYDLCIVGAGMFGSAAARHASKNSALKVCLIGPGEPTEDEWKEREIYSSYYDEGRITRIADDNATCQFLSKQSIKRYQDLERQSEITFFNQVGCLFMLTRNTSYYKNLLEATKGTNLLTDLSNRELFHERYPFLKLQEDEVSLLDISSGGYISPRQMVAAQKKVAEMQGCRIYENVVTNIFQTESGVYQISLENCETEITCKKLLIATGAFINTKISSNILKPLKVKKYKRSVSLFKISAKEAERLSSMPSIIYQNMSEIPPHVKKYAYILPPIKYPDGKIYLKIGFHGDDIEAHNLKDIQDWFNCPGHKETIDLGSELLLDLLPGLKYESITSNTCVNCYTDTGLPYIDRVTETLTVAVAGNGKGAKFSDEVGRLAALLSVNSVWDSEINQNLFKAVLQK